MPECASQTIRFGAPGSEPRNALQSAGWAVGNASARHSLWLPGVIADRAEDIKRDPTRRNPLPARVQSPDSEGQMIEQQRALGRPGARAVGLEHDRSEQLDPIGDELPMIGLTNLPGLRVDAKAASAITGNTRRAHVSRATADRVQRLRDPPRDELVVAGRLRTLALCSTCRSHRSQESRQASSRGSSSVNTCGLPPARGTHLYR